MELIRDFNPLLPDYYVTARRSLGHDQRYALFVCTYMGAALERIFSVISFSSNIKILAKIT